MGSFPAPTPSFALKKATLLNGLSLPASQYTDASPKGSIDAGIRHLIDDINAHEGLVTTSSCAGRVSVYLEGKKSMSAQTESPEDAAAAAAAAARGKVTASRVGGKGGGEWLYVSHDPVEYPYTGNGGYEGLFGLLAVGGTVTEEKEGEGGFVHDEGSRLIHFKFEPMILHILAASPEHAQLVIQAGMEAGFRETGAVSLLSRDSSKNATPVVAVRSMGLGFESLIGSEDEQGRRTCLVTPSYLATLVRIANERFAENSKRIARFQVALKTAFTPKEPEHWEEPETRRKRKRQEGLERSLRGQFRRQLEEAGVKEAEDHLDMSLLSQETDVL